MKHMFGLNNRSGFTLIEVIIALVILSISAAALVMAVGDNLARSVVPVTTLNSLLQLQEEMETINARYYSDLGEIDSWNSFTTFLGNYSSIGFSLSESAFDAGDGNGANPDIRRVVLTSNALGGSLVTLMANIRD